MPDKESMELEFSVDSNKIETTIKTALSGAVSNINKDESLFKLTPHVDSSSLQNEISNIIKSINTDNLIVLKTKADSKKVDGSTVSNISNENKIIENQTKIIKENNNVKQEASKITDELNKKTKELLNNKSVNSSNSTEIININDYVKAIGKLKSFEIELQSLGEYGKGLKVDFEDLRNTLSKSFTTDEFADWTKKFQAANTLLTALKKDNKVILANSDTLNLKAWNEQLYKIEELIAKLKNSNLKNLPIVNIFEELQNVLLRINTQGNLTSWIKTFDLATHKLEIIKNTKPISENQFELAKLSAENLILQLKVLGQYEGELGRKANDLKEKLSQAFTGSELKDWKEELAILNKEMASANKQAKLDAQTKPISESEFTTAKASIDGFITDLKLANQYEGDLKSRTNELATKLSQAFTPEQLQKWNKELGSLRALLTAVKKETKFVSDNDVIKSTTKMEGLQSLWTKTSSTFDLTSSKYTDDYTNIQKLFNDIKDGVGNLPKDKLEDFNVLVNKLTKSLNSLGSHKTIAEIVKKGFDTSSSIDNISEINKALTNLIANTKTNSVDFSKAIENVKNAMNKYYGIFNGNDLQMSDSSAVKSLNVAFDKLKMSWNELQNATTEDDKINKTKALTQAYTEYQTELTNVTNAERELRASLRNAQATQRAASNLEDYRAKLQTLQNTIQNFIRNNDRVLNNSGYAQQLNSLSDSIATSLNRANLDPIDKDTFNRFRTQFSTLRNEIVATGNTGKTFATKMAEQFSKLGIYFSAATIFMRARSELKKMYDNVLALDTDMTELKKVTNETSATYTKFLDDAINRATKLGSTLADTVNATADFARLGYNISDASTLADSTLIYKQVGDDIQDISEASSSIISTMKAFDVKAEDSISIVDKFNEVSNNFAISSGGIGEALQNSASSLAAANNTLGESIALIVAGNDVIQNPNEVGTALKTKRCLCVQQCA